MSDKLIVPENCAILLLNYNNWRDTVACLRSISKLNKQPQHVLVVDNGSDNESSLYILNELKKYGSLTELHNTDTFDSLKKYVFVHLDKNVGFSAGNNAGLRLLTKTSCDAFWLLNNDTLLTPTSLEHLCKRISTKQNAAFCGSTLIFMDKKNIVQCTGGARISPFFGTSKFINGGKKISEVLTLEPESVESRLDEITGASLLVRKSAVKNCGLMDESFFLYREDSEWSLRARRHGYSLAWAPKSLVYHKEGGTSGAKSSGNGNKKSLFVDYLEMRNRFFLVRKYYAMSLPLALLSLFFVYINRIKRRQLDRLPILTKAAFQGILGHMGFPALVKNK